MRWISITFSFCKSPVCFLYEIQILRNASPKNSPETIATQSNPILEPTTMLVDLAEPIHSFPYSAQYQVTKTMLTIIPAHLIHLYYLSTFSIIISSSVWTEIVLFLLPLRLVDRFVIRLIAFGISTETTQYLKEKTHNITCHAAYRM